MPLVEHCDLPRARGRIGTATAKVGGFGHEVMVTNDVGGGSFLPPGKYRIRVIKGWYDYENGKNYKCQLIHDADVEKARKAGTTGHAGPTETDSEERNAKLTKAAKEFDPHTVYVSEFEFKMDRPRTVMTGLCSGCHKKFKVTAADVEQYRAESPDEPDYQDAPERDIANGIILCFPCSLAD